MIAPPAVVAVAAATARPRLTIAAAATTSVDGLRVTVREVAFFDRFVTVTATFANLGERGVTILPYGRSALRDGASVYRVVVSHDRAIVDERLLAGVRLAPRAQITGRLAFALPPDARPHRLVLTVAPNLLDGADAPFAIELPPVTLP